MKKNFYKVLGVLGILFIISYFIFGFPLIVLKPSSTLQLNVNNNSFIKGDTIKPLKQYDLIENNCSVYLVIHRNEVEYLPSFVERKNFQLSKVLWTDDIEVLKKIQKHFNFTYTGGDIATCQSMIYVYSDNDLIFQSAIVLEEDKFGLQNQLFGWTPALNSNEIIRILKEFKPYYYPILSL